MNTFSSAPIPADEEERLAALVQLDILDTDFEPAYDAIVELASVICETPISNFTLVDRNRQWHKASKGMSGENPRDVAFCAHTILADFPLIVEDAAHDERFANNPLVAGDPHIRFYAGQRVTSPDGHAVGSLCVIDTKPRTLTEEQVRGLQALARQASCLLELRFRSRQLQTEVTERTAAERAAQIARERAEEANLAKTRFLTRMSHELRTPLNSIIGFSRVLMKNKKGSLAERDIEYLDRIERNGRHLLRIINDLLDIAKVNSGKMSVDLSQISLAELVEETVRELEGQVLGKPVVLLTDLPPKLGAFQSDRGKLKQMLINLAGNAIKFTREGSITIRVLADADSGTPTVIEIADTGEGIPANKTESVFGEFEQVDDSAKRVHGGTGLGLAITKAFAELLGYKLELESELGVGTTVRIRLGNEA